MNNSTWKPIFTNIDPKGDLDMALLKLHITFFSKELPKLHETVTRFTTPLKKEREIQSAILKLIEKLKGLKSAALFYEPVAWQELNLTDYPEVVKFPMDFQTLEKLVHKGNISGLDALAKIDLIYRNCMLYNPIDNWANEIARDHQQSFYRRLLDRGNGLKAPEETLVLNLLLESEFKDITSAFNSLTDLQLNALTSMINELDQNELSKVFGGLFLENGDSVPTNSTFKIKTSPIILQRFGDRIFKILGKNADFSG